MIPALQHNPYVARSSPQVFNEGAGSTAHKIITFVAALLAAVASFFLLPAETALLVSGSLAGLLALCSCLPDSEPGSEDPPPRGEERPRPWYSPVLWAIPNAVQGFFFSRNVQPVLNPGPRVPVGGVPQPNVLAVPLQDPSIMPHQQRPHVPANRGHNLHPNGFFEPNIPVNIPAPVLNAVPALAPMHLAHVPAGHGH